MNDLRGWGSYSSLWRSLLRRSWLWKLLLLLRRPLNDLRGWGSYSSLWRNLLRRSWLWKLLLLRRPLKYRGLRCNLLRVWLGGILRWFC